MLTRSQPVSTGSVPDQPRETKKTTGAKAPEVQGNSKTGARDPGQEQARNPTGPARGRGGLQARPRNEPQDKIEEEVPVPPKSKESQDKLEEERAEPPKTKKSQRGKPRKPTVRTEEGPGRETPPQRTDRPSRDA